MYLLIIIRNASQTLDLHMLKKEAADKHRSFIMVLIEDARAITEQWLHDSFKKLWEKWILNVVIIFHKKGDIEIWGYTPFTSPFLIRYNTKKHSIARKDIFPEIIPNMNGHKLKICIFPDKVRAIFKPDGKIVGADGFMVRLLTDKLNASTKVISSLPWADKNGYSKYNGSADTCLRLIANNYADISLNTRFLIKDMFGKKIENSVVYDRDDLCVIVPKSGQRNSFWNVFRSFKPKVWIFLFATFLLTFIIFKQLAPSKCRIFLKLFGSIIEMPFGKSPKDPFFKFILAFWLGFCLLMSNAYKGNLTSNLVFRENLPDLDTLSELAKSRYQILIYERHQQYINKYVSPSFHQLILVRKKIIPVSENYFHGKLSENNISFAYMEKAHMIYYMVNSKEHYSNGQPIFHVMKSCPFPFESVYIVPYGSPYLGYLNKVVRAAQETGIIVYWSRSMDAEAKAQGLSVPKRRSENDDPEVLILEDLKAVFAMLSIGLVGACICFIYEIIYFYVI